MASSVLKVSVSKNFILKNIKKDENGCWKWQRFINEKGYGIFSYKNKRQRAHRTSYEIFVGEIPNGMFVCHKCDVRDCVNPRHLFLGTAFDNNKDMEKKGRHVRGESHPLSKITAKEVMAMRIMHFTGASTKEVSLAFGKRKTWVGSILRMERWKHLPSVEKFIMDKFAPERSR